MKQRFWCRLKSGAFNKTISEVTRISYQIQNVIKNVIVGWITHAFWLVISEYNCIDDVTIKNILPFLSYKINVSEDVKRYGNTSDTACASCAKFWRHLPFDTEQTRGNMKIYC